jgi:hypothetical protein
MTGPKPPPQKSKAQLQREKRLAEALRANLRRRKTADFSGMAAREEKSTAMHPPRASGDKSEG